MNRALLLILIGLALSLWLSPKLNEKAVQQTDAALSPLPKPDQPLDDPADYFGPDPREEIKKPEVQEKLADARMVARAALICQWAGVVTVLAGLVLAGWKRRELSP